MTKPELRSLYKDKRKQLSETEIEESGYQILEHLKTLDWSKINGVHIFLPIKSQREVNTYPIIDFLLDADKTIAVPKVVGKTMVNCRLKKNTKLITGAFNTIEPESCESVDTSELDLILMPMFICDIHGNRVGYGGGYYDRFLANEGKDLLKIGINFFEPIKNIEGTEAFDIPLDYCVTPSGILSFSSSSI